MQKRIGHLVVIAGTMAAGKTTLIQEIYANRLPELGLQLGIEKLSKWQCTTGRHIGELPDAMVEGLVLDCNILWGPYPPRSRLHDTREALFDVLIAVSRVACEVSLVTLWTPPERLEQQHIVGKLQQPITGSLLERGKSALFRLFPKSCIMWLARRPFYRKFCRLMPKSLIRLVLVALGIYVRPDQVVQLYRRWFEFCERQIPAPRNHLVIEFDHKLKCYSFSEWEKVVRCYESGGSLPTTKVASHAGCPDTVRGTVSSPDDRTDEGT